MNWVQCVMASSEHHFPSITTVVRTYVHCVTISVVSYQMVGSGGKCFTHVGCYSGKKEQCVRMYHVWLCVCGGGGAAGKNYVQYHKEQEVSHDPPDPCVCLTDSFLPYTSLPQSYRAQSSDLLCVWYLVQLKKVQNLLNRCINPATVKLNFRCKYVVHLNLEFQQYFITTFLTYIISHSS